MSLPVIDLTPLRDGSDPSDVAAALDAACRDTGFFAVEGHGIPPSVRAGAFEAARRLFALPAPMKAAISIDRSPCHRGYVGIAAETLETLEAGAPADLKEAYDLSRDLGPDHAEVAAGTPLYGANQWPELEGFQSSVEAYYDAAFATGLVVMRGLALALALDEHFFTAQMTDSITNLRLIHYPPQTTYRPEPGQPGCGAHSDYGMVTLLAQDDVGGLEVRHRNGEWIPVAPNPAQIVVNIGDMLAMWSGGRWVSTLHRVITPESTDRYSVPMFVNPGFHDVVAPIDAAAGASFEPVKAGEYLLSRFDGTFSYRQPPTAS